MAFKPQNLVPGVGSLSYYAPAGSTFISGQLIYRDTTTSQVRPMTSTAGDVSTVEAIVTDAVTVSGSTLIRATPVVQGLFVVADCTNNTSYDQLNKAHVLTDGSTVANTSTHQSGSTAIFVALNVIGASADKKLFGYIVKLGQVTA